MMMIALLIISGLLAVAFAVALMVRIYYDYRGC